MEFDPYLPFDPESVNYEGLDLLGFTYEAAARGKTRADGSAKRDLSLVQGIPYTINFTAENCSFTYSGSEVMKGTVRCTATYSVKQLFIYPGQESASGDYYIIQAHYS